MRRLAFATILSLLATAGTAQAQTDRLRIGVNGGVQIGTSTAHQDFTYPSNLEDAHITNDVDLAGGGIFDIGGAVRVTRAVWVGVSFSSLTRENTSELSAELPHPFYFNKPRTVDATVTGLKGKEQSLHISVLYPIAINDALEVAIFGGPSYFSVAQDLVTGLDVTESYPFDEVTVNTAQSANTTASGWGGHVGADISWRVADGLRVGALVRYARGSAAYDAGNGDEVAVTPGGLVVGGGVRVVF